MIVSITILVSCRGDGIYKFSINHSPEELGSGSDQQRKDPLDPDEHRDRDASDPRPSSTSHVEETAPMNQSPRGSESQTATVHHFRPSPTSPVKEKNLKLEPETSATTETRPPARPSQSVTPEP